jgi:hypothetical protein
MGRVCRANIDKAGGIILEGSKTVLIDGFPVALEGNRVQAHGTHRDPVMVNGSQKFIIEGIPVIVEGTSKGSCGDPAISASSTVTAI